jgi:hypothetical protein
MDEQNAGFPAGRLEVFWRIVIARRDGVDGALAVEDHMRGLCVSFVRTSA